MNGFHHVELWVPDLASARPRWDWLLTTLGWTDFQDWSGPGGTGGHSWRAPAGGYLVVEQSVDLSGTRHERTAPGMNHLALDGSREQVDRIAATGPAHGWTLLFADRHPHAGGPDHYAAFLADPDGYEVEIVDPDPAVS
ncbi:VOC family protein [Nakamurella alba]|uniref:VOC family protein n=1 Tax=Nakamurella alba TaxID=2665158 RepID=UPI001E415D93|nr:VOC family protein [Nakamurella alba]